ncbi:hypothetical protein EC973_009208 [Apophysomyces ossiformis]|uniref:ARS binding protein 2-domain-containing protein n=1 Tax=Apophysomyces ossiformis TaxID=679940 RepID=A0A8H7BVW0_9FUNG|nr:hypothetical protein EC973_009208 [Apophysomyces ossiformis]
MSSESDIPLQEPNFFDLEAFNETHYPLASNEATLSHRSMHPTSPDRTLNTKSTTSPAVCDSPGSPRAPGKSISTPSSPEDIAQHAHTPHVQQRECDPSIHQLIPSSNCSSSISNNNSKKIIPVTRVTGENVNSSNIEDGYIQFVIHHDPQYIGDGIESLMYVKRKFSSVPRTGDLSYTTWDVFLLVKKLHNQEIKNWSQLVGQLGLSDMAGRPQFAQRVKRWMHKYKIDCYFDYLLGNPFNFHSSDEKYSGCLMMGNYQKRKARPTTDETDSVKSEDNGDPARKRRRQDDHKRLLLSNEDDSPHTDDDEEDEMNGGPAVLGSQPRTVHSHPILFAGSRKRMRDASKLDLHLASAKLSSHRRTSNDDFTEEDVPSNIGESPQRSILEEDEEDELVSSSSSVGSPVPEETISDAPLVHQSTSSHTESYSHQPNGSHAAADNTRSRLETNPVITNCSNCTHLSEMVKKLEDNMLQLKKHVTSLENKLDQQVLANESNWKQIDQRLSNSETLYEQHDRWRKQLIETLLKGLEGAPSSSSSS